MKSPLSSINPNLKDMAVSATLHINEVSKKLIREGRKIYKFGLGESPFPVPDCVVSELQANAHQKSYLPVSGLPELQTAIADHLSRTRGMAYAPGSIMIGPGSKELLFILQLAYNADLILPSPSWVSYAPQAHIANQRVGWLPTDAGNQWKLTAEVLEAHCRKEPGRPRLLIMNYPNNPHGYTYSTAELKALAEAAAEHRVLVLSDEIYGGLHHKGEHASIASYYPDGTILSDGLSKWCGAGGWRLGFFAFPESLAWLKAVMATIASETFTSVSAPIQYAGIRAFEGGPEIDDYLVHSRRILEALGCFVAEKLRGIGCSIADPEGGFYLFPDLSCCSGKFSEKGIRTGKALCETILQETGAAMLPGSAFGRPAEEFTARLSYVDFDGAKALKAARQMAPEAALDTGYLETYCSDCVEGVNRLCEWVAARLA